MHSIKNGLRNTQRDITTPPAKPRSRLSDGEHTGLILEELTRLTLTELPQLRDLRNGVVPLHGARHIRKNRLHSKH